MAAVPKEYPAGSIHSSLGWEGQFARVSRWLDRLMHAHSPEDAEDFLYAFFQNCYHLRDWISTKVSSTDLDSFFKDSLPLRICRDAANLTKHSALDRKPAQEYELSILREYAGIDKGWFENDTRLVIVTNYQKDGIVLDSREVARECLRLWCIFLPDCDLVREVKDHFRFSANDFGRTLSEAEATTKWAREVTK
jgi:hypothetical protein